MHSEHTHTHTEPKNTLNAQRKERRNDASRRLESNCSIREGGKRGIVYYVRERVVRKACRLGTIDHTRDCCSIRSTCCRIDVPTFSHTSGVPPKSMNSCYCCDNMLHTYMDTRLGGIYRQLNPLRKCHLYTMVHVQHSTLLSDNTRCAVYLQSAALCNLSIAHAYRFDTRPSSPSLSSLPSSADDGGASLSECKLICLSTITLRCAGAKLVLEACMELYSMLSCLYVCVIENRLRDAFKYPWTRDRIVVACTASI